MIPRARSGDKLEGSDPVCDRQALGPMPVRGAPAPQDRRPRLLSGSEGPACPHCGNTFSKVLESRSPKRTDDYRRRRECNDCHQRFTTVEAVKKIA